MAVETRSASVSVARFEDPQPCANHRHGLAQDKSCWPGQLLQISEVILSLGRCATRATPGGVIATRYPGLNGFGLDNALLRDAGQRQHRMQQDVRAGGAVRLAWHPPVRLCADAVLAWHEDHGGWHDAPFMLQASCPAPRRHAPVGVAERVGRRFRRP